MRWTSMILGSLLAVGCSSDDGGAADSTGSASSGTDSGTGGTTGAGTVGTGTAGSGSSANTTDDTGDQCTGAPPSPPPSCDGVCGSSCGCDSCTPGYRQCNILGGAAPFGTMLECGEEGNCEDEVPCAADRTCILLKDLSGACSDALDCDGVQMFYDALVGLDDGCQTDDDCRILEGKCGVGLGACYHAVGPHTFNGDFFTTQAVLDELAAQWTDLGCMAPVCDCPAPPAAALCDNGTCTLPP